jgi:hypothetical protein
MPFTQLVLTQPRGHKRAGHQIAPNQRSMLCTRAKKSSSAWNLPMIGPIREREYFVDKLAIAEY